MTTFAYLSPLAGHLEWLVEFPSGDVSLAGTKARFDTDGTLSLHVPRLPKSYEMWSMLR